jgi:hypothetical protein
MVTFEGLHRIDKYDNELKRLRNLVRDYDDRKVSPIKYKEDLHDIKANLVEFGYFNLKLPYERIELDIHKASQGREKLDLDGMMDHIKDRFKQMDDYNGVKSHLRRKNKGKPKVRKVKKCRCKK